MARKVNPNKMSPEELNEYVQNLPERVPPKTSSALWLAVIALVSGISFYMRITTGDFSALTWVLLGGTIAAIAGTIYLLYRIATFNKD